MDIGTDRIKLTFLLDNCPVLHNNPKNCPLYSLRLNSIKEKLKWLESLSDNEISDILLEHSHCYKQNLQK